MSMTNVATKTTNRRRGTSGKGKGKGSTKRPTVQANGYVPADPLERAELAKRYGYALNVIYSNPELKNLFESAFNDKNGQWTAERFQAELQSTNWYKTNDYYARTAWTQEQVGGADWVDTMRTAKEEVRRRAGQLGARLTGPELDALARRFVYEGWGQAGRSALMDDALSGEISYLPDERGAGGFRGEAGSFVDELRLEAQANGINYGDTWYQDAARSVARGDTTKEDWIRDLRKQAAGKWGPWGKQIENGQSAYSLASPYINSMAETLELNPNQITLDDPYIQQAMMGTDGQAMPLWDFQRKLRNDPRWMNTNFAQNQVTSVADAIMQMFGARG